MPTTAGFGPVEARSWEVNPGLSHGWQVTQVLELPPLPLGTSVSKELESEAKLGIKSRHSDKGNWTF